MKINKKIIIATAAALAIFGMSSVANASPLVVTVASVANVTTTTAPKLVAVPSSNVIDASHTVALSATVDTGTVVTFTGNGVKLVSALSTLVAPVNSASGVASVSVTSTGVTINEYVYSTSTTVGSVTVTNGSYSTIVYVQGVAGVAANISLVAPLASSIGLSPTFTVMATDVFGNPVTGESVLITVVNATISDGSLYKWFTTATASTLPGVTPVTILGSASGSLSPLSSGTVTILATDASIATTAVGLPVAVKSALASFSVLDLLAQITSLNTQVASLNQQLNQSNQLLTVANTLIATERASHVSDLAVANKELSDAKSALDSANSNVTTLTSQNATLTTSLQVALSRIVQLVKSYNTNAKKYHFKATK